MNLTIQARPVNELMLTNSYIDTNRIDHAIEYILEVLMCKKNAIPEQKKQQGQHPMHIHKTISINLFFPAAPFFKALVYSSSSFKRASLPDNYNYQFYKEINPPPPKA